MWNPTVSATFAGRLSGLLRPGGTAAAAAMPRSAEAFLVWQITRMSPGAVLWIGDGPRTLQVMYRDLLTLAPPGSRLLHYPSWETIPGPRATSPNIDVSGERLATLNAMATPVPCTVIASCVQALMQMTPSREALAQRTLVLAPGVEMEPGELALTLEQASYDFQPEVQEKAQAALRGGILDLWPPAETWPLRLEFFGPVLQSVRAFNPADQRSIERRGEVRITPADEWRLLRESREIRATLLAHLPDDAVLVWSSEEAIRAHAAVYEESVAEAGSPDLACPLEALGRSVAERRTLRQLFLAPAAERRAPGVDLDFRPAEAPAFIAPEALQPDVMEERRRNYLDELAARAGRGQLVCVFFDTQGALERFQATPAGAAAQGRIHVRLGMLSGGFVSDELGLTVVAESDLYGRRKITQGRYDLRGPRAGPGRVMGSRLADWTDIEPGDLVVHVEHGIGRYLGLREIRLDEKPQEVLAIEYADRARLYVPVSQAHLLTRYVGVGRRHPSLHRLGGKQWDRDKAAAERSVHDLAAALLETQAARNAMPGHAFPPDAPWQHPFEAAFPYRETPDQERAISEVKADMEAARPMDRLVCGDAGYGKTEVAMRAAFKAVMDNRQVAVLVPTTVLAQQHFYTFRERMAAYPVRIEMLSRFCSRGEHDTIVKGLADGSVDIVIGTHALIQPHVRFRDLGLVIIDEEQRFGVIHKERLKQVRRLVDVLTLTATPIPRTLYMSLTGARDLSTIETPPQDRLTIETVVAPIEDDVVREAILRELNREGQVFYVHNRVRTIDRVRDRLCRLVPEARVEVAHGQMPSSRLEEMMQRFVRGDFDVLLCTTIIESGMDIPNANTILIDRADRFGMAELYQLRGRVGRSKHKAYACMLLPRHAHIDPLARRRIQAIKQYTDHGAGFRLAMRDLEIRGAGNLLGAEQSGHIAAVGFALYCQLLRRTVSQLKGEPVPPIVDVSLRLDFVDFSPAAAEAANAAVVPTGYVEDERLRVGLYRKIAEASFPREIQAVREEIGDRFGPVPAAAERLLRVAQVRIAAAERGVTAVDVTGDKVMMTGKDGYIMRGGRFPRLRKAGTDERLDELIRLIRTAG